jgi:hypothetical protein
LSAFGNKIGYKLTVTEEKTYTLSADIAITGTTATLTSVDGLKIGDYIRVDDGTNDETKEITDINTNTKVVTFTALANVAAMTVANTEIFRQDIKLEIAVKDINGFWEQKETHERMPFTDDVINIINRLNAESYYLIASAETFSETDSDAIPANVTTWTELSSGSDGTTSTEAQFVAVADNFDDEDITILVSPAFTTNSYNLSLCTKATNETDYVYYVGIAENATESTLKALGAELRKTVQFAMIPMDKWFETKDPLNLALDINIPNTGILAAHYFNEYYENGVGRVAAGNRTPINTAMLPDDDNGLIHDDKAGLGDLLIRDYSVNIGRWKKNIGTTINSARTLSTDDGYKYQNQLMGFILLKKSILDYLQSIEQDQSGLDAQETHYFVVWTYLKKLYDASVFYKGQREDGTATEFKDVVQIVNDFSINTLADIANGIEQMFVQVIFVPPIEEPILSLASAPITSIGT